MSVALSLRPLGEALGTEVVGVDVSRPFDAATLEWIDRAFAEHPVMVFSIPSLPTSFPRS
jgi:alpha-ketoglutarate-dependent taurine dioxygenase